MKIALLINMKMPTMALSYLLAEKISCSAELSTKKKSFDLGQMQKVWNSFFGSTFITEPHAIPCKI